MTVARSVSDVLKRRVVMEIEGIDRLYLNLYVPILQRPKGCAHFFIHHRGMPQPSTALMAPITRAFVRTIENFALTEGVDIVSFEKGQRKEELVARYFAKFRGHEGVLFIGKAQEKARVVRTVRRHSPVTGAVYPSLVSSAAMVNHNYFYCVDRDFGAFFIKLCSYFPYNGRVCLNGSEYLKRQLDNRGVSLAISPGAAAASIV